MQAKPRQILRDFQTVQLNLYLLNHIRVGYRFYLARPSTRGRLRFWMFTLPAFRSIRSVRRINRFTFFAFVMRYAVRTKFIAGIPERIFVLLWPITYCCQHLATPLTGMNEPTYGSRGQSVHRTWLHLSHILFPAMNSVWHSWQVRRTRCRGFL